MGGGGGLSGLGLKRALRSAVQIFRFVRGVGDGGEPEAPLFADGVDHVKDDAGLGSVVEVQPLPDREVEQVLGGEVGVERRLLVIGRDVVLGLPVGGGEDAGIRVVGSGGEELQRQEWMGRSSFAEVDLDGVGGPDPVVEDHHEVHRQAAHDAFVRQTGADLGGLTGDHGSVVAQRWEATPHVALAARPPQELVVSRQQLDFPQRGDPKLNAGALDPIPDDPLLHHAPELLHLAQEVGHPTARQLELHALDALLDPIGLLVGAGPGQAPQVDDGVPLSGDPVVQLDEYLGELRILGPHPADGVDHVGEGVEIRLSTGMGDPLLFEELPASGFGAEGEEAGIRSIHGDAQLEGQVPLQLGGVEGDEVGVVGWTEHGADPLEQTRPLQELARQGPARRVEDRDQVKPLSGVAGDHPGKQPQVVVDHLGQDRLRGHIDDAGAGLPEQQEQKQAALLVPLQDRARDVEVE